MRGNNNNAFGAWSETFFVVKKIKTGGVKGKKNQY